MSCNICYNHTYLVKTSCEHTFCNFCIKKWLLLKNTCPLCRKIIYKNDKVYKNLPIRMTRSLTYNSRENLFYVKLKELTDKINQSQILEEQIELLRQYFKLTYENISIIKNNSTYKKTLIDTLNMIENNKFFEENAYDVKIWIYKFDKKLN